MWDSVAFDSLDDAAIADILQSWTSFCGGAEALIAARGDLDPQTLVPSVAVLSGHGLQSLVEDHFLQSLEEVFKKSAVVRFWKQFDVLRDVSASAMANFSDQETFIQTILTKSLEEICQEKHYHERCLLFLVHALESYEDDLVDGERKTHDYKSTLTSRYHLMVSSVLLATLPSHFPEILRLYFKAKLEELSNMMVMDHDDTHDFQIEYQETSTSVGIREMDTDCGYPGSTSNKNTLINDIGMLVRHLRSLGFTSMTEDAYTSAIFSLLKAKVHELAGDDYRIPVLESMKEWIQAVPLQFLHALLAYLGDTVNHDTRPSGLKSPLASSSFHGFEMPSEGLIRWKLRLEYFAYETLQDLRIGKLFEIIVDYPDSCHAIEDLKECLDYTGQHSKLVDSFISSLRYRLLTAGASTNDILHQYVSTIKALRTIDPTGVFLEAVGQPIRDYLRGRKDTIKCIVTMLTDGTGAGSNGAGNAGDSLLEELNRDADNQETADYDDDVNSDEKQAWINSERWEPDPAEVDPLKGSRNRRKIDILGMIVSIIGSKDQLVSEYRVMLAEKLLNKCDYDIDTEIRTLELLKIHFGESSMQKCEIMMNDLIDSKRTNGNIRASIAKQHSTGDANSLDLLNASIISSNFWPPIQGESLNVPTSIDQLLSDYSKRYHEIKAPRKLLWKKNLGMVKLELQFEDRNMEFTVSPPHAVIIMQFQEKQSWTSKDLAAAVGVPVDTLNRKINFWISKGVLAESIGTDSDEHVFTIVNDMVDASRTGMAGGNSEVLMSMDEEGERSVASVEEQLQKEMTVYEKFIVGMLTNFGSMSLDIIHNRLKMFCIAEPKYDKSLQQLQNFLSGLISEEKLELRDGVYFLKK